jgi:hypothetical protein
MDSRSHWYETNLQTRWSSATWVCELLTSSRSWDNRALSENLVHMDDVAIKHIPLAHFGEDFWAWTKEKHGLYSIRSAYRMLADEAHQMEDFSQDMPSCSGANNSLLWKKLWQSKVPRRLACFGGGCRMNFCHPGLISIGATLNR